MSPVRQFTIESRHLQERRHVSVFVPNHSGLTRYPVLFCTDGQCIPEFGNRLDRKIREQAMPPCFLIGPHSHHLRRGEEYIHHNDSDLWKRHAQFFVEELSCWTDSEFPVSVTRQHRGIFGFSHGAAFVLELAAQHHESYGVVIAFSAVQAPTVEVYGRTMPTDSKHYLSVGTREKSPKKYQRSMVKLFQKRDIEFLATERFSGHDMSFWNAELTQAIQWSFGDQF